jgi:hypothetical protein
VSYKIPVIFDSLCTFVTARWKGYCDFCLGIFILCESVFRFYLVVSFVTPYFKLEHLRHSVC